MVLLVDECAICKWLQLKKKNKNKHKIQLLSSNTHVLEAQHVSRWELLHSEKHSEEVTRLRGNVPRRQAQWRSQI